MQTKFRAAMLFNKLLRSMTEKTVHDIFTKNDWKEKSIRNESANVRKYSQTLGLSEAWVTEYVYKILLLAKKEGKRKKDDKK